MKPSIDSQQSNEIAAGLRSLRKAAQDALELARRTGTPCYVWRDGKVVDALKSSGRRANGTKPRKLSHRRSAKAGEKSAQTKAR